MRSRTVAYGAAVLLVVLSGCSSTPAAAPANAGGGSSPSVSAKPSPVGAATNASAVIARLKAAKLPIGEATVYGAASDPNHLLGRPGGYTSKAAFTDTRINPNDARDTTPGSVDLGGSVEVFATSGDATAREQYIQAAEKAAPIVGTEYDYVSGPVLLRVSQVLTPQQAAQYKAALG